MKKTLADGTELVTLPNGLRIVLSKRDGSDSSAIVLTIGVGSKNESELTSGLCHFLEHMMFKGTKSYPKQDILDRALASIGADFNAETDIETTTVTFLVPNNGLLEALKIMGEIISLPLLSQKDVEKECEVVIQELDNDKDSPDEILDADFSKLIFPNHSLGRPIVGTTAGLRNFRATDLRKLHKNAYTAGNMVLSIVSSMPEKTILNAVHESFSGVRPGPQLLPVMISELDSKRTRSSYKKFSGSQAYLTVGGRGPSWHASDRPAADLAVIALGGSLYARLPLLLRGKLGEVYTVQSFLTSFVETGVYSTSTDCSPALAERVLEQIMQAHSELSSNQFTQEEIDLARSVIIGGHMVALDDSAARAEYFANRLLLHGVFIEPRVIYSQWEKVTASEANKAAMQYLAPGNLSISSLSPIEINAGRFLVK